MPGPDKGKSIMIVTLMQYLEKVSVSELFFEAPRNYSRAYTDCCLQVGILTSNLTQDTASKIKNCKSFMTNTLYHETLFSKSNEVMK